METPMSWFGEITNQEAVHKLDRIIRRVTFEEEFFIRKLIQMSCGEGYFIPSMATDGKKIYYNPNYIMNTEDFDIMWTFIHEIMHVMLEHPIRLANGKGLTA